MSLPEEVTLMECLPNRYDVRSKQQFLEAGKRRRGHFGRIERRLVYRSLPLASELGDIRLFKHSNAWESLHRLSH